MRRALIVGVNEHPSHPLKGCIEDARKMAKVLSRHYDGSTNFECKVLTAPPDEVTRPVLREHLERLFAEPAEIALFYFSGHGAVGKADRLLVTKDAVHSDQGLPLNEILTLASNTLVREAVILLDSCYSGAFGQASALADDCAVLREGLTVLTASRSIGFARESPSGGAFTSFVYDALNGGAADICGRVTLASVYAYIDQVFGAWEQRPLFKAHVSRLNPLRRCRPQVRLEILHQLPIYFPTSDYHLQLTPAYEPSVEPHDPNLQRIFSDLQVLRDAHLLVPVEEEHLYYAAIRSKGCCLTPLGQHYWQLVKEEKL